jgi:serine/threonine-protein kinase
VITPQHPLTLSDGELQRYTYVRCLGQGGIASVYQVLDRDMGIPVALKILRPEVAESDVARLRLRREFEILTSLDHPAIAHAFEMHEPKDAPPFFTLELIHGESLDTHLTLSPLSALDAVTILEQVARAVGYLHDRGIVFCDLKPSNIMVRSDAESRSCVLIDFGLAHDGGRFSRDLPSSGALVGTSLYMAPEQIRGESPTLRMDIYAFGVLAYELLAGRTPFESHDTFTTTTSHLLAEVPDVRIVNPNTPKDLARMMGVCLAKEPDERYETMWEILERLDEIHARLVNNRTRSRFFTWFTRGR